MNHMPQPVRDKYESLPPRSQNNSRQMFMSDWEWAHGNSTKESIFADKWGLHYEGKFAKAEHLEPLTMKDIDLPDWNELPEEEVERLLEADIY